MAHVRPFQVFSAQDDLVWQKLYEKQMPRVEKHASRLWLEGLKLLNFPIDRVPDFNQVNERLQELTGWKLVSTDVVYSDGQTWFEHLIKREFLITEYIRDMKDLDYTPLPDIWHDAFGHLPFMAHQRYADYIEKFANYAVKYPKEERRSLGSMWWYTIEFGFMMEEQPDGGTLMKAFGAGLMSSPGEMDHALSDEVQKIPYSLEEFEKVDPSPHVMHDKLFILDSLEQLEQSVVDWVEKKEGVR